jgi:membrane protein YqaA with SNARE-associated domain
VGPSSPALPRDDSGHDGPGTDLKVYNGRIPSESVTAAAHVAHLAVPVPAATAAGILDGLAFGFSEAIETATGWFGLVLIFVYSFLIAFALPGVSEIVLLAPLDLGLTYWGRMTLIMAVSGAGKALGSVFAFHIGQEAKQAGPVIRLLKRSRFDVVEWSERAVVRIAREYGYAGLAVALCVPGFPDTLSIYAFAVLGEDYAKFAAATFVGSVGRLAVTLAGVEAFLSLV